jgi:hypothetical protein
MYPNADTASLANYYLANRQVEQRNIELIDELCEVLRQIIADPRWNADRPPAFAQVRISKELYDRAVAALEALKE